MIFTKKSYIFILFSLMLPVSWHVVLPISDNKATSATSPKRPRGVFWASASSDSDTSTSDDEDTTATPPKRPRGAFWDPASSGSDTSAGSNTQSPWLSSPERSPRFMLGQVPADFSFGFNGFAAIESAFDSAVKKGLPQLDISRPATPNDGFTLDGIAKILATIFAGPANASLWDELIEAVDTLHNKSTIKTLADHDLLQPIVDHDSLHNFVQRLIDHAIGNGASQNSKYERHALLSQKLTSPYLALLSLANKLNKGFETKLSMQQLELPVMNCPHIFTPNKENGYHQRSSFSLHSESWL